MASPFGVYVHVPFCSRRCDYCAFATYTDRDHLMGRYVDACIAQLAAAREEGLAPASSVFFGGGTPSRLPADELCRLLDAVPRAPGAEVTVECNPEDADLDRLTTYHRAGVDRMSFGVQSTRRHVLSGLGRVHDRDLVARALSNVSEAGFGSYNVDLIFGGAGETDADWDATLTDVLGGSEPPPHVSAYALTVEPGTPLAADAGRHPDDDVLADRYERADERLAAAGYRWEEVSNWARPGHGCRHNRLYWRQGDYLGVGSAAHSHRAGRRWWNVRTPERYVAAMSSGRSPVAGEEVLSGEQRRFEALALALRTPSGVPEEALPDAPELEGLVVRRRGRAVLTVRGRLLANALTARLVAGPGAAGEPRAGEGSGEMPVPAGILPP
ncbi:MAG TPA: radical SAM family heme chaperone HemW [Acidimicrobiales bacterium]|nr:radical SAM family heme chaperone HemW [Acidimicrobiales bacterium]